MCMCVCVGLLPCMSLLLILRFYGCVFTWLHLGLVVKYNSDSTLSHKNKISVMLYYSLKGETRGYNRKHMWMVMVHSIRVHWIAIRPGTISAHKHTHTSTCALCRAWLSVQKCFLLSYYQFGNHAHNFSTTCRGINAENKNEGKNKDKKNNGWLLSIFLFSVLYIY